MPFGGAGLGLATVDAILQRRSYSTERTCRARRRHVRELPTMQSHERLRERVDSVRARGTVGVVGRFRRTSTQNG